MRNQNYLKKALKLIGIILIAMVAIVVSYVAYMSIQYYRIEDNVLVEAENNSDMILTAKEEHSVITYNIGFGAYNHDFSFFMDSGVMKDGTNVKGSDSKAESKEVVIENTNNSIKFVDELDADFYLFQEVDTKSTRSHNVNQYEMLKKLGSEYSLSFANNFHSAFLMYPLTDPHGSVNAGLTTMSKYKINESIRRQYPVSDDFITKFTDLDRCFLLSRIPVDNGKELVLINTHMSAYDEGGLIRKQQLKLLNEVLKEEYAKGNYVIVGGDFNHDIAGTKEVFNSNQNVPEWVFELDDSDLTAGYTFAIADNSREVATCRSTDMPYIEGENYMASLDGFIVSDNIKDFRAENMDTNFISSDHNPVSLYFILE